MWITGLIVALSFVIPVEVPEGDCWNGQDFLPRPIRQSKIGAQEVALNQLLVAFDVQEIECDSLRTDQARVENLDVVSADEPIEEFSVARHGDDLIIPVTIDGQDYPFLVDTGTSWTVVDHALKSKLLLTARSTRVNGSGDFVEYRLPNGIVVGNARFPVSGEAVCIDLEPFRKTSGHNIRGLLGMTFLRDKIVRIDFDAGKLAILRSGPDPLADSFHLSFSPRGTPLLDLEIAHDRIESFQLDTGQNTYDCGAIQSSTFKELLRAGQLIGNGRTVVELTVDGENQARRAQLKQCRLGRFEHANLGFKEGRRNKLGLGYFSRFCVTFDFQNHRVHLKKGERFDTVGREDLLGAHLNRVDRDTFIEDVAPSSPASDVGLCDGDRVVLIDGEDSNKLSLFELRELFSNDGRRVRLIVQGGDEPRAVEVQLDDWELKQIDALLNKTGHLSE